MPPVWRHLDLSSALMLDDVHRILQAAFGFTDSHLHRFAVGPSMYDDASALHLSLRRRACRLGRHASAERFVAVLTLLWLACRPGARYGRVLPSARVDCGVSRSSSR
jgi:hypothetical protein